MLSLISSAVRVFLVSDLDEESSLDLLPHPTPSIATIAAHIITAANFFFIIVVLLTVPSLKSAIRQFSLDPLITENVRAHYK